MMGNEELVNLLRQLNEDHQWSDEKEAALLKKINASVEEAEAFLTETDKNGTPIDYR